MFGQKLPVSAARLVASDSGRLFCSKSNTAMRYLEEQNAWLLEAPRGHELEVLAGGSADAAKPASVALVDRALSDVSLLESSARGYLREFLSQSLSEVLGSWTLEGLESGCGEAPRDDQVALVFSDPADTYGQWSVSFQFSSDRFFPVAFGRRQI